MDYAKQYQEYLARANQALEKACEIFLPEESEVCRAARYSLLGGGKRIRAVLVLPCAICSTAALKQPSSLRRRSRCCTAIL